MLFPWKNVPNPASPSYPDHLALDSHGSGGGGQLKYWQWWSLTIAKEINFWEMKCYFNFFVANISLNSLHICVFHCLYRIMNECMTKHLVVGPLFNWMTPTLMKRGGGVTNGFEICSRDLIFAKNIVISLVLLHPEMIQNAMNHDSWWWWQRWLWRITGPSRIREIRASCPIWRALALALDQHKY